MVNRISLTHLTFVGPHKTPASVDFGPRTTVIHGPSDTGKSFIVDAIDFMLGGSSLREIPQRAGYSTVLLGIRTPTGDQITLTRSVDGGNFGLLEGDVRALPTSPAERSLGPKHAAKSDNLSRYILELLELDGKRLRVNLYNKTRELSIRDVARLNVVDETKIQSEIPPALSGRPTDETGEVSVLKLFLEGNDDSGLVQVPSNKERRQVATAKLEVVDAIIQRLRDKLRDVAEPSALQDQLNRLNAAIRHQNAAIASLTDQRRRLADRLVRQGRASTDTRQKIADNSVLEARFLLLLQKYESDLARLEMIGEAGNVLGLFTPGICVVCGADPEYQRHDDHVPQDATNFGESVAVERRKTELLAVDLLSAIADLRNDRQRLSSQLDSIATSIGSLRTEVRRLDEAIQPQTADLSELADKRGTIEGHLSSHAEIDELENLKAAIAAESTAEKAQAATSIDLKTIRRFSDAISDRLTAWQVPDGDHVRYDRNEQDLIAGDQLRSAHGKGVRAILHSAFTIGLAQYCFDNDLPHSGFVVLDSPLVTYRPPKAGEIIDDEVLDIGVAARFYADIQQSVGGQVIIMENMDPPGGLQPESTDVFFTGIAGQGRFGFFPT